MSTVIYPRGFLGFDIGIQKDNSKVTTFLQTVRGIEFNRPINKLDSIHASNPAVDALWKDYVSGAAFTTSFAFRERILVAALGAFGTQNFYDWCILQSSSPFLSSAHRKFFNDTLTFIETGKRSVNVSSWLNILSATPDHQNNSPIPLRTREYFGVDLNVYNQRSLDLSDNLVVWTSQQGGFEDLLGTLVVLFGAIN